MICPICNSEIQTGARFCSACGQRITPAYIPVQDAAAQAGLVRPREGRMIAGVCRGFAQRYGWDVAPFLGYIVAWIVMPNGPFFVPAAYTAQPVASQPEQGTQPQA
jgi:phage shock protein C